MAKKRALMVYQRLVIAQTAIADLKLPRPDIARAAIDECSYEEAKEVFSWWLRTLPPEQKEDIIKSVLNGSLWC